jgi:GNAT superfamily N-acetyltransferase
VPATPDVVIRRALVDDAAALAKLHIDCWDDAYTGLVPQRILDERRAILDERVEHWRDILSGDHHNLVAEVDGGLEGFAAAGPGRDNDLGDDIDLELYALYVRAAWWGTGLGYLLFEASVGDRAAYLWVLAENPRAIRFYERQGFRFDGSREERDMGVQARMVRAGVTP